MSHYQRDTVIRFPTEEKQNFIKLPFIFIEPYESESHHHTIYSSFIDARRKKNRWQCIKFSRFNENDFVQIDEGFDHSSRIDPFIRGMYKTSKLTLFAKSKLQEKKKRKRKEGREHCPKQRNVTWHSKSAHLQPIRSCTVAN